MIDKNIYIYWKPVVLSRVCSALPTFPTFERSFLLFSNFLFGLFVHNSVTYSSVPRLTISHSTKSFRPHVPDALKLWQMSPVDMFRSLVGHIPSSRSSCAPFLVQFTRLKISLFRVQPQPRPAKHGALFYAIIWEPLDLAGALTFGLCYS